MAMTTDHTHKITSENQLRKLISAYPKILDKRLLIALDHYCLEIISLSTITVIAYEQSQQTMQCLSKENITIIDDSTISISSSSKPCNDRYVSLYFLVPGVGHGLRVNGIFKTLKGKVVLHITTAYLHCARAAARAELWERSESPNKLDIKQQISPEKFLSLSPYLLMKTLNENNETELSPRGDQAGFVQLIDQDCLFIPERPGNKVAVSLRNIINNQEVELLLFMPGTDYVMHVNGRASLSMADPLLDLCVVNNKRPKLGILIEQCSFSIELNHIISHSKMWSFEDQVDPSKLTRFSKALSAHMNGEGLLGKAATPFIAAVVKNDMKHLY